jgi:hypothetical protein
MFARNPFLVLLPLALLVASCGTGGSGDSGAAPGQGSLTFEATDAPIDPELIRRAELEVDAIRVHREADAETGFTTVFQGGPIVLDLTSLRNGVTRALERGFLEAGSYRQVRIHVTDAMLELKSGKTFSTRAGTIRLTSQDTSGYKVFFQPPIEVFAGVETRVLLDFQLPKTFSPVPGNDLENARFLHLHPSVRGAVLQETGELRGIVRTTDSMGAQIPAADAAVYVLPPGETDPDQAIASTLTDADGSAAILGVPVGTYDVLALHGGRSGRADGLSVQAGAVTSFDILVE